MTNKKAVAQAVHLFERITAALPQTQCTRCGYVDCDAYAKAISEAQAPINQCPPGGEEGIARLAQITGQPIVPLNPAHGIESERRVAFIDENWCIGCTLCIKACPVDAIIGASKHMHTIIEKDCTGCELCLPVCPVDCIEMEAVTPGQTGWHAWSALQATQARQRYLERQRRLGDENAHPPLTEDARSAQGIAGKVTEHNLESVPSAQTTQAEAVTQQTDSSLDSGLAPGLDRKRAIIEAALARAQKRMKIKPTDQQ